MTQMDNINNTNEEVFFDEENILITNSRLVINGKTYAMNLINSVHVDEKKESNGCAAISFIILGLLLLNSSFWILGIIFILLGIIFMFSSTPSKYFLIINTASGDNSALESSDLSHISSIKNSIEKAIVFRG